MAGLVSRASEARWGELFLPATREMWRRNKREKQIRKRREAHRINLRRSSGKNSLAVKPIAITWDAPPRLLMVLKAVVAATYSASCSRPELVKPARRGRPEMAIPDIQVPGNADSVRRLAQFVDTGAERNLLRNCDASLRSAAPLWRRSTAPLLVYRGAGASLAQLFRPWQNFRRTLC